MVKSVRSRSKNCAHTETITIRAAGTERIVCESCGHVSFKFLAEVSDPEDRAKFRREIDNLSRPE
jgi:hypothetical protein